MPAAPGTSTPPFFRRTFVVARIAGIEVAVHITWFAIFTALAFAARAGIVPEVAPRLGAAASAFLSIGFALLFYSFVLAHEFAHALVARAYGLRASRITLFFFGGVAQIGREARDPAQEFRVAVAGPLTSLLLAGFLAAVSRLVHPGTDGFPGLWGALGAINLALALFNLVPGFPLDGGRILRSALWAGTGDRARATRWAGVGGKVVAFALMGTGAVLLTTGGGSGRGAIPGLWGLMLGWFLYGMAGGAAAAEGGAAPTEAPERADDPVIPEPRRNEKPVRAEAPADPVGDEGAPEEDVPEPHRVDPRETALRLDRVLFGDDAGENQVRSPSSLAKVGDGEGQAPSSHAHRRGSRPEKGQGSSRTSSSQPRDRSRHS